MKIRCGFDIAYDCPAPTPMLLLLNPHPSRLHDLLTPNTIGFSPPIPAYDYRDGFGNTCTRIVAPAGRTEMRADFLIEDSGLPDRLVLGAVQHPVEDLPDDIPPEWLAMARERVGADFTPVLSGDTEPAIGADERARADEQAFEVIAAARELFGLGRA